MKKLIFPLLMLLILFACKKEEEPIKVLREAPPKSYVKLPTVGMQFGNCVEMNWEPIEGALYYRVQIVSDTTNTIASEITRLFVEEDNFVTYDMEDNGSYFIRVLSGNNYGESEWSAFIPFAVNYSIAMNCFPAPEPPILIRPYDEDVLYGDEQRFNWFSSELATHYHLQVATDASFFNLRYDRDDIEDTLRYVSGFGEVQQFYFWRTRGFNNTTEGDWGEVRRFKVQ